MEHIKNQLVLYIDMAKLYIDLYKTCPIPWNLYTDLWQNGVLGS